jgi:CRP-like cAMP-binding protein
VAGSDPVSRALQRIALFAGLPDDRLEELARGALLHRYPRGQIVCHRGEPGDRAFVIVSGAVDLIIDSPDGRELILVRLEAGEHFGEMALVDDHRRSATARTAAPTELVAVLRSAFLQALDDHPEMSRHIIRSLVQRLRVADAKLEAFAYLDAAGRIARALIDLGSESGQMLAVSHEELGHMAATSRPTTTRILDEWESEGYVELARRGIVLKDSDALTALAQL